MESKNCSILRKTPISNVDHYHAIYNCLHANRMTKLCPPEKVMILKRREDESEIWQSAETCDCAVTIRRAITITRLIWRQMCIEPAWRSGVSDTAQTPNTMISQRVMNTDYAFDEKGCQLRAPISHYRQALLQCLLIQTTPGELHGNENEI